MLEPDTRLGHYRIIGLLCRGGMADVYRAVDERLGRTVALKALPPEFARDPERVERFEREVRAAAKLTHSSIVTVYEYGHGAGQHFYTMALMPGGDLKERIRRHPDGMPPAQARKIAAAIARALAYAHGRGYVHRDVKPENILFAEDGAPQLTDFGVVRAISEGTRMTAVGMSIGSPHYMSPEQARGRAVDGRSDIYSLGIVLYEMLAGRVPFDASDTLAVAYAHVNDPVPALPDALSAYQPVLDRLLAKSPDDRYADAAELAQVLSSDVPPPESSTRLVPEVGSDSASETGGDPAPDAGGDPAPDDESDPAPDAESDPAPDDESDPAPDAESDPAPEPGGEPVLDAPRETPPPRFKAPLAALAGGALALALVGIAYFSLRGPDVPDQSPGGDSELDTGTPRISVPSDTMPVSPMDLLDEPSAPPADARAPDVLGGGAMLVAETQPPGAEVLVDGTPVGQTPLERADIRAGAREVTLRHPHYETVRVGDRFADGRVVRIERTLVRGRGALTVSARPRDAWVEADGRRLAERTPVTLEDLPAGPLELTLGAPGHRTLTVSVDIPSGGLARLDRMLDPALHGTLTLELQPPDATVDLPDSDLRYAPGMRLPEGPVRVAVSRAGYEQSTRTVQIAGDTRLRIELPIMSRDASSDGLPQPDRTPDPVPHGTLTLDLIPPDATVTLPDIAPRYAPGMRLPEGAVRVVVSRSGYEQSTRTVQVSGATRARIELSRIRSLFTVVATPADARVRLLDHGAAYRAGMSLPAGDYRVEVSAQGYRTARFTVRHGASATRREVSLERTAPLRAGDRFRDALPGGGEAPEMVVVPSGSFLMGCATGRDCDGDEKPMRTVRIVRRFALSRTEVTFAQWDACVAGGGCGTHRPRDNGWGRAGQPVIDVNWEGARAYAAWLSRATGEPYRLPSEAEWEYAARAEATTKYHWGNIVGRNRANCDGCGSRWDDERPAPAGSFAANAWGLHDMHGNVWEWTQDCWNDSYRGAPADGRAWASGQCRSRVLRGGSWSDEPRNIRAANRGGVATGVRSSTVGFRVARTLSP